jgi:phosphate transport system permease protein
MVCAAAVLAIMIAPIMTTICREVFRAVPLEQREAALALGATRWEVTRLAVLKNSGRGIFGAAMLGLGRALGEAIAVAMVIGHNPRMFAAGSTLATAIVNTFGSATNPLVRSALFELGLVLLLTTMITNALAHLLLTAGRAPCQIQPQ